MKHDFISEAQANYLNELKKSLLDGEFLVTLDFSENYTFQVQNAIQAAHWSKTQATLHVYVIYYRKNNIVHHVNFVVFSENPNHDATGVHLYNSRMIEYLKKKFGRRNVKKINYFSDGAGSQYKNKYNFLNLLLHEKDFGIKAEWHFFATSHGKGACDGIGGSVKRLAFRATLQDKTITTVQKLYQWAQDYFKKIDFDIVTINEYNEHENEKLKGRFSKVQTVDGTRSFHCYKVHDKNSLECKIFSKCSKSTVIKVIKEKSK